MTDPDRCPLCGSTRFEQDQVNVGGEIPRSVPGLRSCLDCHDGGAPVLRIEVERLREDLASFRLGFQRRNLKLHQEVGRLRGLLARLEWSGTLVFDEWYDKGKCCPVCRAEEGDPHTDCWLDDELHPGTSNAPSTRDG